MKKHSPLTTHIRESQLFRLRTMVCVSLITIFACLLLARLMYLQLIEHRFYSTLSQQNLLSMIPVAPNRGLIFDRNGVLLAKDVPMFNLAIVLKRRQSLSSVIENLKGIIDITPQDLTEFKRIKNQYHSFEAIPLKTNLSAEEVAKFYVNAFRFPNLSIETKMKRFYPFGKLTAEVVGYVSRINQDELQKLHSENYSVSDDIGKTGIEAYNEKILHGEYGAEEAEINASGHVVRILRRIPSVPGDNLHLTIDSRLQRAAIQIMGKNNGALVVIQPSTGQVLAMVTKPTFNPNLFVNGISQAEYNKLLYSVNHPLYNRPIRGEFAAASTIKPFYALLGLDSGTIDENYRIFDPGWFRLPNADHIYHDYQFGGHGWVDVAKAIRVSCDTFFYNLAVKLGIDRMDVFLAQFGFGRPTGIDLLGEKSGLVPSPAWKMRVQGHPWYTGDTVVAGIGQGLVLVTPLQLASAVSAIAMHGQRFKPTLLLDTVTPDGTVIQNPPVQQTPVVLTHPEYWDYVSNAMQQVITRQGTAWLFGAHPGFTVAAKTGTDQLFGYSRNEEYAQLNLPTRLRNHHLFIAFAPVDHPQIAIAVVVEHNAGADIIAGKLMRAYFALQNQTEVINPTINSNGTSSNDQ